VESQEINVRKLSGPPSLLSTCRTIRKEAGTIFYTDNTFKTHVLRNDILPFLGFFEQHETYHKGSGDNMKFLVGGSNNWDNLLVWLRHVHESRARAPSLETPKKVEDFVLRAAFRVVFEIRGKWEDKEMVLSFVYDGLRGSKSPWAQPEHRLH
jgi:hypothetical protein